MGDYGSIAVACIRNARDAIVQAETELGKLDAIAGDGDHGIGMTRGFNAAFAAVEQITDDGADDVLVKAGTAFADAAGGASGALVGMWIMTIGNNLNTDTIDASVLHNALAAGLKAISKLGKAKPGDKTMIDTLYPFVITYREAVENGATTLDAWQRALPAAEKGMQSTAAMISKRGRASRLGERSRGHLDPGAVSMNYILNAVQDALIEGCSDQ